MTIRACANADCTVAQTGKCLELHENLEGCPHYKTDESALTPEEPEPVVELGQDKAVDEKSANHKSTVSTRQFHAGLELGMEDVIEVTRHRYSYLIGILGDTGVGKTAFLCSLYLLAAHGGLKPDYRFAGSLTLQGFEDRSRRLRKWEGGRLPDRIIDHTQLSEPRTPAFMHLTLEAHNENGRLVDLLLPDLPGEWSTKFAQRSDTDKRFEFLKRCDGLIYMLEGPLLAREQTKHVEINKATMMLRRLAQSGFLSPGIPFLIVVSKSDLFDADLQAVLTEIAEEAKRNGFTPTVSSLASFSTNSSKVASGTGILDTLKAIIGRDPVADSLSSPEIAPVGSRAFERFRLV